MVDDRINTATGGLTTASGDPPSEVAELLFRIMAYTELVLVLGENMVLAATIWLVIWVAPTFMVVSIDNLATKLYAPLTTSAEWAMAHRNMQVFNAVSRYTVGIMYLLSRAMYSLSKAMY